MYIPVEIEIGCMVLVVLPIKDNHNYINNIEKWCVVTEIFDNYIKIDDMDVKIPLYTVEYFTFGGIRIPNPEFDIEQILKMK